MASNDQSLIFTSGYMQLYVPWTPFAKVPTLSEPQGLARFVGFDDVSDVLYDIDYDNPFFKNQRPWEEIALHTVQDPAIVFAPAQLEKFLKNSSAAPSGFLVAIQAKSEDGFQAMVLGQITVKHLPVKFMNHEAIKSAKYPEMVEELQAGLLRRLFNKQPQTTKPPLQMNMPVKTATKMPRKWLSDPAALNHELDRQFAGVELVTKPQKWILRMAPVKGS